MVWFVFFISRHVNLIITKILVAYVMSRLDILRFFSVLLYVTRFHWIMDRKIFLKFWESCFLLITRCFHNEALAFNNTGLGWVVCLIGLERLYRIRHSIFYYIKVKGARLNILVNFRIWAFFPIIAFALSINLQDFLLAIFCLINLRLVRSISTRNLLIFQVFNILICKDSMLS